MPIGEMHKQKKTKNIALLVIMLSIVALFFSVTIIKFNANKLDSKIESKQ